MAVQDYKINYKSDFVLTINGDAGWATQFCIKFWTGMPSQAYFVGFDGVKYVNCRVGDTPTQLLVMFDDHHLPIGKLMMQIAYHTTIEEFPGSVFDEVTNARDVIVTIDGTDYQVMLDFTGEDAPELEFDLPAYANEAERIQNELQRQQNEADRIAAELQREQATAAAVQGAENVNAQLNGTTLTVTNRQGVSTSVNTKGEQGEQGPVGPEGPQGKQGVSIVSFTPKSETSTTLIYTVTFSDGHTQDVAIPKGAKGDTGATGPQGPQGDTGVSITGFVETGETETDTLYNITFSNGTIQQVAIPKGAKGDTGPKGPVGPQGPQGPMGDVAVITPEQQAAFTMYSTTGQNTNGPMTQKAVTDELYAPNGDGSTETIPSYTLTNGRGVLYDTGELTGNLSAAAYTSLINVSGYNRIVYGNLAFGSAPSTHLGMAFYDANQNFIPNSGRSFAIDPNAPSYVDTEIQVPSNAVYARFCAYATTYLTGFYVKLYSGGGYYNRIGSLEKSKGAYDVSAANNGASYGTLSSALSAIPDYLHAGGMSVKFIDSSSNKYVQYTLTSSAWSTTESDWVLNEYIVPSINKLAKALVFPSQSTNKWSIISGRYSVFVPVDGDTEYIIEGNDQQSISTYYAIIKDTTWTGNAIINNYATGENSVHTLPVNTTQRFTTPSDARFVCVMVEYNGIDISPKNLYKVVKFNNGSLYGKKVLCVGDSVTWMKFYTDALQQKTKCILYNRGVSGTTVANYGSLPNAFVERADLTANDEYFSDSNNNVIGFPSQADYVFVLGGVNDWARVRRRQSFTLGGITAANNKTTFIGAWKYLLSKLKEKYPMAKIVTMLMYDVYTDAGGTTLNHSEVTLTNGSDIAGGYSVISQTTTGQSTAVSFDDLRNAVKEVSKLYGAECLDLREAGFSAFIASDRTNFYNNADGLHVNANGGEYIANYIVGRLF